MDVAQIMIVHQAKRALIAIVSSHVHRFNAAEMPIADQIIIIMLVAIAWMVSVAIH